MLAALTRNPRVVRGFCGRPSVTFTRPFLFRLLEQFPAAPLGADAYLGDIPDRTSCPPLSPSGCPLCSPRGHACLLSTQRHGAARQGFPVMMGDGPGVRPACTGCAGGTLRRRADGVRVGSCPDPRPGGTPITAFPLSLPPPGQRDALAARRKKIVYAKFANALCVLLSPKQAGTVQPRRSMGTAPDRRRTMGGKAMNST
jgi:hypothetical protein